MRGGTEANWKKSTKLTAAALALAAALGAQTSRGTITGTVLDPTGAVMRGARVTLIGVETGVRLSADSNDAGVYRFDAVDLGVYELRVSHPGFRTYVATGIGVEANRATTVDPKLEVGAAEIVVVDTIGACGPEAVEFLVREIREWVGPQVPVHFHGHNDFGMATACAVAAVRAGASWIQGTINGMGERAGNADICEIALALRCLYDVPVVLDLTKVREVSKLVQQAGGYELEGWRPLVGENLFMRESGAVASQFHIPEAIEPYSSELVGAERHIVLGKKSGLDSIDVKAKELGLVVQQDQRGPVLAAVKKRAIAKRGLVSDQEFRQIVHECAGAWKS